MKTAAVTILVAAALSLGGCFYSFSDKGSLDFESVHISQVNFQQEAAAEFEFADRLTDALVDVFIADNIIEVSDESRAEAILETTVTDYRREPHTYDANENVSKYAVRVSIVTKARKPDSEDLYWQEDFFGEGIYDAATETDEEGKGRVIEILTQYILDRATKSW